MAKSIQCILNPMVVKELSYRDFSFPNNVVFVQDFKFMEIKISVIFMIYQQRPQKGLGFHDRAVHVCTFYNG